VLAACADCTAGGEGGGKGAPAHPLHHALMCCIEEVARRRRLEQRPAARHAAAAAAAAAEASATAAVAGSKRAAPTSGGASGGEGGGGEGGGGEGGGGAAAQADAKAYLCSGCDAYVTLEPCAMCAMALAHARIRRLVYAVPCASEGALGSRYRVHTERSINHHYQVFRGLLCDEARAALDVDESRAA
jgi:tRNA-specific adenosine deaminase 3